MAVEEISDRRVSFFERLKAGLSKSRTSLKSQLQSVFSRHPSFDDSVWDELEEVLIRTDVGVGATLLLVEHLRGQAADKKISAPEELYPVLKERLIEIFAGEGQPESDNGLTVYLVVGVNGTGKTTSIAKLAYRSKGQGKQVLLAAADTFRAAAIEQLDEWGRRVGVEVIKHQRGADASAVVFDAVQAAKSRRIDHLIIDTAGRLHTYVNLMEELKKIKRIALREAGDAKVITLLVVDATTGQNAVSQAKMFNEAIGIDGILLTKLDGTAKGGIVVAIKSELGIPVSYVGLGEKLDDLQEFSAPDFVEALLSD